MNLSLPLKKSIKHLLKTSPVASIVNHVIDVRNIPSLSGKFFPYQSDSYYFIVEKQNSEAGVNLLNLPVPPKHLWDGYGETVDAFLAGGEEHVGKMKSILEYDNFRIEPEKRVLELGCASARMLRWLVDESKYSEIWGVDINAEHILWCQQHLSPPFYFSTNTTEPHLQFSDEYFDLIYAGSVFTHISDLADAWLLELRRILKKGGRLYITVFDNNTINILKKYFSDLWLTKQLKAFDAETNCLSSNFGVFSITRSPKGAQVFYDIDYLQKKLSRLYSLKSVNKEAYGFQTAILLQKE